MNQIYLIGNVGNDPVIKQISAETRVSEFSLATSYKNKAGESVTEWHNIKGFNWVADLKIQKGSQLLIAGKLQYDIYENKDGIKITRAVIVAQNVKIIQKSEFAPDMRSKELDFINDGQPF